jgi:TRAP-type transport system small permease protein
MEKLLELIDLCCRRLTSLVYLVVVILGVVQVFSRYLLNTPIIWIDELSKYLFIWLIFLGVVLASRRKAHFCADFFVAMLPKFIQRYLDIVARVLSLTFLGLGTWYTPYLMEITKKSISSTVGIPLSWVYAGMLVGFFLTFVVEAVDLVKVCLVRARQDTREGEKTC